MTFWHEDYPVKEIHEGKTAKLVLETDDQRNAATYYADPRSLLTTLDHCACANPRLKTEIAIYAAIDVAVDLSIASGLLWSKRPDIVATLWLWMPPRSSFHSSDRLPPPAGRRRLVRSRSLVLKRVDGAQ